MNLESKLHARCPTPNGTSFTPPSNLSDFILMVSLISSNIIYIYIYITSR